MCPYVVSHKSSLNSYKNGLYCNRCKRYVSDYVVNERTGSTTCRCGCIIERRPISHESEWRNFDGGTSERARASTAFDKVDGDEKFSAHIVETNKIWDGTEQTRTRRVSVNKSSTEKHRDVIRGVVSKLLHIYTYIPNNIVKITEELYDKMCRDNTHGSIISFVGYNLNNIAAALFFKACQQTSQPIDKRRFMENLETIGIMPRKNLRREFKFIEEKLDLYNQNELLQKKELYEKHGMTFDPGTSPFGEFKTNAAAAEKLNNHKNIKTLCAQLSLKDEKFRSTILDLFDAVYESGCTGGQKINTVVGTCFYICCSFDKCKNKRPLSVICKKVDIRPETINVCYNNIRESATMRAYLEKPEFKRAIYLDTDED